MRARAMLVRAWVMAACFCAAAAAIGAQAPNGGADARVLAQTFSVAFRDALLADALTHLRQQLKVPLAWSGDVVPANRRVTVALRDTPLRGILAAVLAGSGLDYEVSRLGTVIIVPAAPLNLPPPERAPRPTLAISDAARRALAATGVGQLDAVVVMGSAVDRNPERDQPTAIGRVERAQISTGSTVQDVIRTMLPGLILWDRGSGGPPASFASIRGVSSFTTRALKTYVDGVELASPELFTLVDARALASAELIRGPQGAALYGPDALNGILQLETLHGTPGVSSAGWRASAGVGRFERDGLSGADVVQDYALGVHAGNPRAAFDLNGAFSRSAGGERIPTLDAAGANLGSRVRTGPLTIDISARAGRRRYADENVAFDGTLATPRERVEREIEERAAGFTALHHLSSRWRQSLVVGYHRISGIREPFHSPLITPALPLGASDETAARTSIRYATTAELGDALTVTAGAEQSRRTVDRLARVTTDLSLLSHDDLRSIGGFLQGRLRIAKTLVVSGGSRAEHLSSVAPGIGTLWASTVGASWTRTMPSATVRLRAAWGNGIRPPEPGMNQALASRNLHQEGNPSLEPERQRGVEGGVDLFFAHGVFLKATVYDQRALDLIQQVRLRPSDTTTLAYQFQNVGAVRNRGIELEAGATFRRFATRIVAYVPRSELLRRGRSYTGDLRVGDELLEVPRAAGSISLEYTYGRVSAEIGASWIGSWIGIDWRQVARIEQRLATRRALERDYWREYPAFARPLAVVSVNLPGTYRAFMRADNFAGTSATVRDNLSPPLGRTLFLGVTR